MTWAGRSRSRSLARPVSARTRRTSPIGNALAITPRLMWSLTRMPAGRPARARAIVAAHPRASASMALLHPYVNRIGVSRLDPSWTLPALVEANPLTWMAEANGLLVDLCDMPREVQEIAFEKGMIPYIPADRE